MKNLDFDLLGVCMEDISQKMRKFALSDLRFAQNEEPAMGAGVKPL